MTPMTFGREFQLHKHTTWRGHYPRTMAFPGDGTVVTLDGSRVTNRWPLTGIVSVRKQQRPSTPCSLSHANAPCLSYPRVLSR